MHPTTPTPTNGCGSVGSSRRRSLGCRAASGLAAVIASVVGLGLASAPAMADDCPNAALRAENNSTQLPDCRAYELVSNPFAEGFAPVPTSFTEGRVSYISSGNFADNGNGQGNQAIGGNQYIAARSANGWSTSAPGPSGPTYVGSGFAKALSSDLRSSLWTMRLTAQSGGIDLYVRRPNDVFARLGPASGFAKASDDLSHVVFPDDAGRISEYNGTGEGNARSVSVDNTGQQIGAGCPTRLGSFDSYYRVISADGRVIFWTGGCAPALYARVNGTTTIDASASQCTRDPSDPGGACNADSAPVFEGANASGTRVYFTTDQQLINADTDSATDLYECDIPAGTPAPVGSVNPCPDLREVSGAASGGGFEGVARVSEDGSRVYFVASGVLASNPGANDATAVSGDHNLYDWHRDTAHPDGLTTFVGKVAPDSMWGSEVFRGRLAQTTDDGRYLVFSNPAALIDHGPQADTDSSRDVYLYDAESGALTRLSTDADGTGGNESGNEAQFTTPVYEPQLPVTQHSRSAISDDGGSVVFTTTEGLAPGDTNGTVDTYLWRDGRVSLISSGRPSNDYLFAVGGQPSGVGNLFKGVQAAISPSGRDVYFTTTVPLTRNDVDTGFGIYDARIDGGFDLSPPPQCTGDACQGGRSAPPPASQTSSSSTVAHDDDPAQVKPAFSVGAVTAADLRRIALTGKVPLSVTTNVSGVLSATATATIAKRASGVGSAERKVVRAGTVSLSLTLFRKARAELKSKRKLTVKVLVAQDNVAIARTVALKLTQPSEAKKAKKKSSRTPARHASFKGGPS
jgi:hypothetical protein